MIEVKNLCKSYGEGYLYKDFNIEFEEEKVTALLGASGSGKTTLTRMLLGVEKYEKGHVIGLEKKNISVVFQEDRLIKWLSVYKNIAFVLKSYMKDDEMEKRIQKVLELVELWEYKDYKINTLSGGMQRRVALARTLAYSSDVLMLDEPFKGQDYALRLRIITRMKKQLKEEKRTTILITHDMEEAKLLADILYTFKDKPVRNYKI